MWIIAHTVQAQSCMIQSTTAHLQQYLSGSGSGGLGTEAAVLDHSSDLLDRRYDIALVLRDGSLKLRLVCFQDSFSICFVRVHKLLNLAHLVLVAGGHILRVGADHALRL